MNSTLFDLPECPSPRLRWMKEHEITTLHSPQMEEEPWCAYVGVLSDILRECILMETDGRLCYGDTEQEAVERLARAQGWKLWNEI